jgi:surface protein
MNRTTFQIYGTKKTGIFQSTWNTTLISLGTERATSAPTASNWALNGGISLSAGGYKHTPGSTESLTTNLFAVLMRIYQIIYTISERTAGSVSINFSEVAISGITASGVAENFTTTVGSPLSITPTTDFDGVVAISLKEKSSNADQIKLPLPNIGTYSILVDWGDGTTDNITTWNSPNTLHTYSAPGTYSVRISGDPFNWRNELNAFFSFNPALTNQAVIPGDKLKIKKISSWGKLKLGIQSFAGCSNLTLDAVTDIPDLSGVTSFFNTFGGCSKITTIRRVREWNTSTINNFNGAFSGCTLFDQDLGNWNTSAATNLGDMFSFAPEFNNGGTSSLNYWDVSNVTSFSNMFRQVFNLSTKFNNGFAPGVENQLTWNINTSTSSVSMASMFQNCTSFNSNLGTGSTPWNVSKVTDFTSMFYLCSEFNNGNNSAAINDWNVSSATTMAGMFRESKFNQNISSWDVNKVTSFATMFYGLTLFNNGFAPAVANKLPWNINTNSSVNMSSMFFGCYSFNSNLGTASTPWNVSKVTSFNSMFALCPVFNNGDDSAAIDDWDLNTESGVSIDMQSMFNHILPGNVSASVFNRPIGSWNMSNVVNISRILRGAIAFNQPLSTWERTMPDVSTLENVISTREAFYVARVFNQPIGNWNVSNVLDMTNMFNNALVFNQDLSNWNTANVTTMSGMFYQAFDFDQCIGSWNVSKVTSFEAMFYSIGIRNSFNNGNDSVPLNDWTLNTEPGVSINISYLFDNSSFNRNLNSWNTSKVTNMQRTFARSTFNNGNASGVAGQFYWDTSACITMNSIFVSNPAFNCNLGTGSTPWDVSNVQDFNLMFGGCGVFNNGDNSADINTWDVSSATTMFAMFGTAFVFNRDIGSWDVSNVSNFTSMFSNASAFNNGGTSSIDNWQLKTTGTISMDLMFADNGNSNLPNNFNQPISSWNVSRVVSMASMFTSIARAISFNQPLSNWERISSPDTSTLANVTNMQRMFFRNTGNALTNSPFDQDIGNWNVSNVNNFTDFMAGKTQSFSSTNLDSIYNGWSSRTVRPDIVISFGSARYTSSGQAGKDVLETSYNWDITDGGT